VTTVATATLSAVVIRANTPHRAPAGSLPTEALPERYTEGWGARFTPASIKSAISGLRMGHFGRQGGAETTLY